MNTQTKTNEPYLAPVIVEMNFFDNLCADSPYAGTIEGVVNDDYVWED